VEKRVWKGRSSQRGIKMKKNSKRLDEMIGICQICGSVEIRPSPADVAVCNKCYSNPKLISLVELKSPAEVLRQVANSRHPNVRFELQQTA